MKPSIVNASLQINSTTANTPEIKPLTIGDKVPDITFHNVLNYKSKTAKLSDFQGKLVILDMWSVNCASCIAGFPKMEKLQKEFGDKIQILLVNPHDAKYDSEEKIKTTLDKFKLRTGFYPSLPVPIHDSVLNRYFPHESVPHQVWISGNGNILAISGSNDVTSQNISLFLKGKKPDIAAKNDWAFDDSKPLLFQGNGGDNDDFVFRSIFTKYINGIGYASGVRMNESGKVIGAYSLNKVLRQFIVEAFADVMNGFRDNRVRIDSDKPFKFQWESIPSNTFCYDLVIPPTDQELLKLRQYLQDDLKRFFNISVSIEKKQMTCLIITETDKLNRSYTKYQKMDIDLDDNSIDKYIRNCPIKNVIEILDRFDKPMINETGSRSNIDIEFPPNTKLSDIDVVLQALRNAGFNIREEEKLIDVIVISDKIK